MLTWLKESPKKCSFSWHLSISETTGESQECDDSTDTRRQSLACWELAVNLCIWTSSSHCVPELLKSFLEQRSIQA